jgi:hypothetical protein
MCRCVGRRFCLSLKKSDEAYGIFSPVPCRVCIRYEPIHMTDTQSIVSILLLSGTFTYVLNS